MQNNFPDRSGLLSYFLRGTTTGNNNTDLLTLGVSADISDTDCFFGTLDYCIMGDGYGSVYYREKRSVVIYNNTVVHNAMPEYSINDGTTSVTLTMSCTAGAITVNAAVSGGNGAQDLEHTAKLTGIHRRNI